MTRDVSVQQPASHVIFPDQFFDMALGIESIRNNLLFNSTIVHIPQDHVYGHLAIENIAPRATIYTDGLIKTTRLKIFFQQNYNRLGRLRSGDP